MITEVMNFIHLNTWHRTFSIRYIRSPSLWRNIFTRASYQ